MVQPALLNENVEILSLGEEKKVCKVCENIYVPVPVKESEEIGYRVWMKEEKIDLQMSFL